MKQFFSYRAAGFYPAMAAAILALIALISYIAAPGAVRDAEFTMLAAIVLQVVLILVSLRSRNQVVQNVGVSICALLVTSALVLSVSSQLDYLGNLVSGLYSVQDMINYLLFLGFGGAALLLYLVSSFLEQVK